jgi:patatin-like phospholipase/acyl hydrolase
MATVRRILSCDGGGIRGIITLRCLEALESRVGSCQSFFHMFAGTSTGAVIAGALAKGMSVGELISLYTDRRFEIFSQRLLGFLHPVVTKFRKGPLHRILRKEIGDVTLAELACDVLITAVDTVRSETIYFTSFQMPGNPGDRYGTYRKVRLRDAIEASVSTPTYFTAHGRFIDGGTTVYNNPAYVAAVEALRYSSNKRANPPQPSCFDGARVEVYSFGVGTQTNRMKPGEAERKCGLGWLKYVINESSNQAGFEQSYVAQSELDIAERTVAFYRYDIFLNRKIVEWAMPGSTIDPRTLEPDSAIDEERFRLLDEIGKKYGQRIFPPSFIPPAPPALPASGAPGAQQTRIVLQQGAAGHWDKFGQPALPPDYADQVLREFDEVDRRLDR